MVEFYEPIDGIAIHQNLDPPTLKLSRSFLRVTFDYNKG